MLKPEPGGSEQQDIQGTVPTCSSADHWELHDLKPSRKKEVSVVDTSNVSEETSRAAVEKTLVSIQDVSKTYRPRGAQPVVALTEVNLGIHEHEIVSLIGPSGCGKSTLLRIIAGLDADFDGELEWSQPPRPGKDIGFVFQEPALLPWRTVRRNVGIGLEVQGVSAKEQRARVDYLLELVGLQDFGDSFPRQLSGGMRQRVAIIRALAYDPQILLMDEPFGALDAITRDKLHDDLLRIWAETKKTIVIVTHAVDEATYLSSRVVVMSSRPGRIRSVHQVPFERENRDVSVRQTAEFAEFSGNLRSELG